MKNFQCKPTGLQAIGLEAVRLQKIRTQLTLNLAILTNLKTLISPQFLSLNAAVVKFAFSASLLLKEFERKGSCVRLCQLDNRFFPLMVMPAKLLLQGQLQQE